MPVTPSLQKPATTNQEIWQECSERLKICQEAEGENRKFAIEALEFEDGLQWPMDLYKKHFSAQRPMLTINHTRTLVRRVINNMRMQRPRIKVHPVGEGADIELARKIGGLIRHIEQRSDGATAYDIGGESAIKIGWGYWRILSEYIDEDSFDQELKLLPVRNPFTVYMDPNAELPSGEDAEWVIISEKMKRSEFKRKYPREDEVEFRDGAEGDNMADWESKEEIRLAEYFRIVKKKDWLLKLETGHSVYKSEYDEATMGPIGRNLRGEEIKRPSYRRQVEWHRLNGKEVVQSVELPGRFIPVVRCEGNVLDLNGKIFRRGMVKDMMDAGRMYNYWRSKETETIALAALAPWIGTTQHFDGHPEWNDANQKSYSHLTYNPDYIEQPDGSKTPLPPPQRIEPVAIPAGFVNAAESALKDLMALAGMPHEPGQDAPGEVVSGEALKRRQALSDMSHFQYYDNQCRAIAHTGRILLELIPHYYSEARMQRIIGEDGVPTMVEFNQQPTPDAATQEIKNNLSVGRYDVVMDTGPGYETKRQESAEALLDLLKTPLVEPIVKVGADLVVRNMDFAGADDLADRLMPTTPAGMDKAMEGLPKQAQNIVKAMQQQLAQAQQLIQKQQLEIKYKAGIEEGWQRVELTKERMRTDVAASDAALDSHTRLTDTHVKAQTALAVAEIKEGGAIIRDKVAHGHDEKMADKEAKQMVKAGENGK